MSLSNPRANIIEVMEGLGYTLIKDAFDFQNVGNSRLEKAFHIEQGAIRADSFDQATVTFINSQTIRFWEKGKRNSSDLMSDCLIQLDAVLAAIMDIANRVDGFVDIKPDQFEAVPHSDDNDDIIRGELKMNFEQICAF